MAAVTYKWTTDRYHQAVEAGFFDDQSIELLQGEIVLMAPEGTPHTYFSDRISKGNKFERFAINSFPTSHG